MIAIGLAAFTLGSFALAQGGPVRSKPPQAPKPGATAPAAGSPSVQPLDDAEMAVSLQVHVGRLPCELGQHVMLQPEPGHPGRFRLELGHQRYRISPRLTTTGAIRLEDASAGVVWLQLSNKSMLLDQRRGRRLADDCRSAAQERVAQEMAVRPPPSLLEPVPDASTSVAANDLTLSAP